MLTVYDLYNACIWQIADGLASKLFHKYSKKHDRLRSERDQLFNSNGNNELKLQELSQRMKLLSIKRERKRKALHLIATKLYTKCFSLIARPHFKTGIMTAKNRRLSKRISRDMRGLDFSGLKVMLNENCKKTNTIIYSCDESYTSKLCGGCGQSMNHLGASKVAECKNVECKLLQERDAGASRNILIKCLHNCTRIECLKVVTKDQDKRKRYYYISIFVNKKCNYNIHLFNIILKYYYSELKSKQVNKKSKKSKKKWTSTNLSQQYRQSVPC